MANPLLAAPPIYMLERLDTQSLELGLVNYRPVGYVLDSQYAAKLVHDGGVWDGALAPSKIHHTRSKIRVTILAHIRRDQVPAGVDPPYLPYIPSATPPVDPAWGAAPTPTYTGPSRGAGLYDGVTGVDFLGPRKEPMTTQEAHQIAAACYAARHPAEYRDAGPDWQCADWIINAILHVANGNVLDGKAFSDAAVWSREIARNVGSCYQGTKTGRWPGADVSASREEINHPQHYGGDTTYEVIKVLEAWAIHDFCLGNAIKYIARAGKKDGNILRELRKALWYLGRKILQLEKG